MILGAVAVTASCARAVALGAGSSVTSLWMKYARSRTTLPASRYWIRFAGPVQNGFPTFHAPDLPSGLPASGASSFSRSAGCQALHPPSPAVRNQTLPGPCQWSPTMLNSSGASAAESARTEVDARVRGTSRETILTSASATAGRSAAAVRPSARVRGRVIEGSFDGPGMASSYPGRIRARSADLKEIAAALIESLQAECLLCGDFSPSAPSRAPRSFSLRELGPGRRSRAFSPSSSRTTSTRSLRTTSRRRSSAARRRGTTRS